MTNKTKNMFLVLFVLLVALLAACSSGDSEGASSAPEETDAATSGEAESGTVKELRIGTNAFTAGLAPTRTSNADAQLQYNIYDTLILRDPYSEEVEYLPGLATGWKQLEPTIWEFTLREDVKFHDGTVMDAEDVAYSLNRIFKQEDPTFDNAYGRYFNNFKEVEIVDDYKVNIHTIKPEPLIETFLSDLSGSITSKEYIDEVGLEEADLNPVGAGPYRVASFVPSESAVLERFDDYWGEPAPLEKVTYTFIPEIASRTTAVVNDEVDLVVGIPADQEAALANQDGVELIEANYPLFHVYILNMNNEVMQNKKLRQALDLAIDREALVASLWNNKAKVPTSLQFEDYGEMYMSDVETVEYNVEKAKQLVEESGYDGTPIEIVIRADYYPQGDLAAQAVIEMWKEIGVNAELTQVPDVNEIPDEEVMIRSWSNPLYYPDPMGVMDASWSENIWVSTRGFWEPENEAWDENFEIARFSTDTEERKEAYKNLLEMTKDEAGFILLYQPFEYFAAQENVEWEIPKNYRAYTISLRAGQIELNE